MTNLEFNKDKILEEINRCNTLGCAVCRVMNKLDKRESCDGINCRGEKMVSWLLEEHKEPIKLRPWERDFLLCCNNDIRFSDIYLLMQMKDKGHFKGIVDTSMTVENIFEKCEIVPNDYDFEGE